MAKGGLFDKIKGALVEEDTTKPSTNSRSAPDTPVFGRSAPVTWPQPGPAADPTLVAEVEQRLGAQSSTTYTQFGTLLSNLSAVADERVRFQSAIQVARTTLNLTPDAIRAAYEDRIKAIDQIETAFKTKSQAELSKRVGSGEAEVTRLDNQIAQSRLEVTRLQQQISNLEAERATKLGTTERDRQEVEQVSQQMQFAIESVRAKAVAERDTVARNIPGGVA